MARSSHSFAVRSNGSLCPKICPRNDAEAKAARAGSQKKPRLTRRLNKRKSDRALDWLLALRGNTPSRSINYDTVENFSARSTTLRYESLHT
jgi:hypothetical protein